MQWCADGDFWRFLCPVFSASRVHHTSDLHSKFTLRPHHVWKYGRQSAAAEIRRGKEKKPQNENITSASAVQSGHNENSLLSRERIVN